METDWIIAIYKFNSYVFFTLCVVFMEWVLTQNIFPVGEQNKYLAIHK